MDAPFPGVSRILLDKRLPEPAVPAGYAALIVAYRLIVPAPRVLSAIGERHRVVEQDGWRLYSPRHAPQADLEGHLTFALKNEGLDLAVLKRLFTAVDPDEVVDIVRRKPTGRYARRIWFLYEWLLGRKLALPPVESGSYIDAVDADLQFDNKGANSPRHRVRDNLPGTPDFCPLVFRTPQLNDDIAQAWRDRARILVDKMPKDLLARTAALLLLKDSRSSYVIEGESPPQDRVQRWGRAIGEAGRAPLDEQELLRLQRLVIGSERFVRPGFRHEGGFVGAHDPETQRPVPDHVSARHEDIPALVGGLIAFEHMASGDLDPVVAAAVLAFGFVYIHPFEDGNGRIHRYLMHHVLARRDFSPPGVHFPVSSAILERIGEYRGVLESYSCRLLPCIEWETTARNNVRVLNDTTDFYRFFDATPHAEFLYRCVRQTIEHDLPGQARNLRDFDSFREGVGRMFDMPERMLGSLFGFLRQNDGKLSKRAREKEFSMLTPAESAQIEDLYRASFEQDD